MNPNRHDDRLTPLQHAALFEAAKRRALELRLAAIDSMWSALAAWLRQTRRTLRPPRRHGRARPQPC